MARLPRLYAPSTVHCVVQRPVAGRSLFLDADDYALFVRLMVDAVRAERLALHAYVLLPGEVALLGTPARADTLPLVLQAIGRRYVPHLNRKAGRDGPLWDRRFRSALVDDGHVVAAMRQLERRPVAEGFVSRPDDWPWSSAPHHVGRAADAAVSDHGRYWAMSDTPFGRQNAYARFVGAASDPAFDRALVAAVDRGWAFGDDAFVARLEGLANRRVAPLPRGRPRKVRPVPI